MVNRKYINNIINHLEYFPVVGIIGPRQVGKTTLVKIIQPLIQKESVYLDLELPSDSFKLREPEIFFNEHVDKTVIIDEVQRMPSLFPILRALVDKNNVPGRFILLGSASPELIRDSSESLAGRIIYQVIPPFDIMETSGLLNFETLWLRGGFPKATLAPDDERAFHWVAGFIKTYVERDLPLLGLNVSPLITERFWTMISQINGQILNYALISKSLELSSPTIKRYFDFFEEAFLLYRLQPYHHNISKRLVKSPKLYFTDTGLLHYFLGLKTYEQVYSSVYSGNSWEAFCINQIRASLPDNLKIYFYRTQNGAETDLVFEKAGKAEMAAEIKYSDTPQLTKGNHIAWEDLNTQRNFIITPHSDDYPLDGKTRVCNITTFISKYLNEPDSIN